MKNYFIAALFLLSVISCNNKNREEQTQTQETEITEVTIPTFELDSLLKIADKEVDKSLKVVGYVTHTCKHSGKRCFIVGESQKTSFRVEAKGEIGGFNRELVGSKLAIIGILKERRLSQEYIDQMEKDLNEKKLKETGSAESCQAELNNISEMRNAMKELGKDYYSIYYMDGENYEVLQ